MSSRYAAAHARREQRRRQTGAREYLPLADNAQGQDVSLSAGQGAAGVAPRAGAASLRLPSIDYGYLRADLIRTAVLAIVLFAIMIVLSFFVHA
jgi:hypothetical protein